MTGEQRTVHAKELLVFVVGDFNEGLRGELWNNLFSRGEDEEEEEGVDVSDVLTDCVEEWEALYRRSLNVNITYHAIEGMEHMVTDTNHAPIDWMLCSKNVMHNPDIVLLDTYVVTELDKVYTHEDSQTHESHVIYPSDHFPIVLELALLDSSK